MGTLSKRLLPEERGEERKQQKKVPPAGIGKKRWRDGSGGLAGSRSLVSEFDRRSVLDPSKRGGNSARFGSTQRARWHGSSARRLRG